MRSCTYTQLRMRIRTCLLALICLLALVCPTVSLSTAAKETTLSGLTAQEITDQMTIGWNLGNSLDANNGSAGNKKPESYVTCWGNPAPTQAMFDAIKKAGFNTVRIPTTWYPHVSYSEATQTYVVDEAWMNYVKQVVDFAYEQDMFVIINVHHETWVNVAQFTDDTLATATAMLTDIWSQVAETFCDYDQHLIFEGMNEPRQTGNSAVSEWGNGSEDNGYSWNYINTLNAAFVAAVRAQGSATNQERLLMLPGYCASSDARAINAIEIPENSGNVALSVHAYAPYFFTMDTSEYANHTFPGKSGWGADYETELASLFNSFKTISENKQTPIVIGEFSASDFDNTEDRVRWATSYLTHAKNAGIPCVLWDNNTDYNGSGEAHGYLYRLTSTWYPNSAPVIEAMMAVYGITPDLPEYVEYVPPTFSWDTVQIGENWVELYRSENGKTIKAWGNTFVTSDWKSCMKPGTTFVLFGSAGTDPNLTLQGGWYNIGPSGYGEDSPFVYYYDYETIEAALAQEGVTVDEMLNLYITASEQPAKIYGLYAIPEKTDVMLGDVNGDGLISIADAAALQRFLLKDLALSDIQVLAADCNEDQKINGFDLAYLKRMLLQKN